MSIWKDKDKPRAQKVIDELLNHWNDNGIAMSPIEIQPFLKWLSVSSKRKLNALKIICEMGKRNLKTTDDFYNIYKECKKDKEIYACKRWHFVIPILARFDSKFKFPLRIKVLGKYILISKYESIVNRFGIKKIKGLKSNYHWSHAFVLSSNGNNSHDAWEKIQDSFDCLRGIMEYAYSLFSISLVTHYPSQKSKFPLSTNLMEISEDGTVDYPKFLCDITKNNSSVISYHKWKNVKSISKILESPVKPKSVLQLLSNSFCLYRSALEEQLPHRILLAYWQLAEEIVISENFGGDTGKICSRLAFFSPYNYSDEQLYKEVLESIAKVRNNIVHKGTCHVNDNDINILKIFCESSILWLINNYKQVKTVEHLDELYHLRSTGDTGLNRISDIVKLVRSMRNNKLS